MTSWRIFVRSALICGLAGALLFGLSLKKIEHLPLDSTPPRFNSQEAYDFDKALSKGFPDRTTWSDSRKRAALWLKDQLRSMGYEPKGMQFSEVIAGKQYTDLENVYAEKRGDKHPDEIIAVAAHYDVTDTTVEGAMDDGSGVGTVLELAKVFAREHTDRTVLFLITDSEEFGAFWGARAFARQFDRASQVVGIVNFDFIAPEKQTRVLTLCDGLKTGYTPLWLRELALDSLRSVVPQGVRVDDMTNLEEFIERAMQLPPADHGAFLAAGIPSFNWVGQTDNFAYEMAHYHHTPHDTMEAMRVESFAPFGQGAERVLRSIDGLPRIPEEFRNSSYWKVTSRLYVDGWAVTILHALAFIPFLAFSLVRFGSLLRRKRERAKMALVLRNEAKTMAILVGSLLLGYVVLRLLPALRVITQYETFPATQKSLLLYTPDFLAILVVVGTMLLVYALFRKMFAEPHDLLGHAEARQAFHATFLALIIFLAFLKNSYLAVLLLLPPAYFWMAMRARKRVEGRILNGLLLIGGAITFVTMAVVLSTIFHVGVVYWYLFLSAAYGLISAYTVVLFFMALAVMIRLFRNLVL